MRSLQQSNGSLLGIFDQQGGRHVVFDFVYSVFTMIQRPFLRS